MDNWENLLHPLTAAWFKSRFERLTEPQEKAWPLISKGENVLVSAPTGMGKTLTAFLMSLDSLIRKQFAGEALACEVLYISPLKALANDVQKNLKGPLQEICELAPKLGYPPPDIKVAVRSGDTPQKERRQMLSHSPQILITTPESFHILLCAEKSREMLKDVKVVIVDEIHAMLGDKRGAHLSLSMERLGRLANSKIQRIGLSATQKPIEKTARVLVGQSFREDGALDCQIVETDLRRDLDLSIWVGNDHLGPVATHEYWSQIYEKMLECIDTHKSTIIFTHTRRLVERVSHQLSEKMGKEKVAAHHGSLSKELRLEAEENLKSGKLSVIVASASLELGIDVGDVDLVLHIGSPRNISSLVQRVGRSGHVIGKTPKGIIFPLTMDELLQSAASVHAVRSGVLDEAIFQKHPLDVLAQIIVAECSSGEVGMEELWELVTRSYYYRDLKRQDFEQVLSILVEGVSTSRGRQSSYLHFDSVNKMLSPKRNARLAVITSGGTIPEAAEYDVVVDPDNLFIGRINEDFAIESMAGNVFLLGNQSWQILRVEKNKVRVRNANGALPNIPFWLGEAPGRTLELSEEVSNLRKKIAGNFGKKKQLIKDLQGNYGLPEFAAEQLIEYLVESSKILGEIPTMETLVAERFFDETGGLQLIIHAPFGARINRAWGLALRKRFCLNFDFELQCAATDNAVLFSLSEKHSFPLETIWEYLHPNSLIKDIIAAVLPHPIFNNRFRWNAGRSLAVLRFQNGKKVPIHLQRMKTEDVLASVFPAHVGCQDNRAGPIEPVDHPLVNETLENCLQEAMDVNGLSRVVEKILSGEIKTICCETTKPSPLSYEVLNAAPYAFLDDAPLEERRSRAVNLRAIKPDDDFGKLDIAMVQEVVKESQPEFRNSNEYYEYLVNCAVLPLSDTEYEKELLAKNRIAFCEWGTEEKIKGITSVEKWKTAKIALPGFTMSTALPEPYGLANGLATEPTGIEAKEYVARAFLEVSGPVEEKDLTKRFGWGESEVAYILHSLESKGMVIHSYFGGEEKKWCSRSLAIRMHRRSLHRLRQAISPISKSQYMDYLFKWQYVNTDTRLKPDKLENILWQLQGYEISFDDWINHVFPSRVKNFSLYDLEMLMYGGEWVWGRLPSGFSADIENKPITNINKKMGISFFNRENAAAFYPKSPGIGMDVNENLPQAAMHLLNLIRQKGAMFDTQLRQNLNWTEDTLRKNLKILIQQGLVSSDGLSGLKKIINPTVGSAQGSRRIIRRNRIPNGVSSSRWYLWEENLLNLEEHDPLEFWANQLLQRYGILFREICQFEKIPFPWWKILRCLQKMEAQGKIRGGMFVHGVVGEQFALPNAIEISKSITSSQNPSPIIISASDPLNLTGFFLPGNRIPKNSKLHLAFVNGNLAEVGSLGQINTRFKNEKLQAELNT